MTGGRLSAKTTWLLRGGLMVIPYAVLLALGGLWLWEKGYAVWFAAGTAALVLVVWTVQRFQRRATTSAPVVGVPDSYANWPPAGQAAWAQLETRAKEINAADFPLDDPAAWWQLFRDTVDTTARAFHTRSSQPMLEVPVPHILRIAELVAGDLRRAIVTQVPGAHVLTVNDLRRLHAAAQWLPALARLYRVGSFLANPVAGLAREAGNVLQGRVLQASTVELKQWLIGFLIRQTGMYAIELYSGGLLLESAGPSGTVTAGADSTVDSPTPEAPSAVGSSAPLRVLVCGQVKAGKSSLINALFGDALSPSEMPAAGSPGGEVAVADVLPATDRAMAYTRTTTDASGLPAAVVIDTPGYADVTLDAAARQIVREELPRSDLVLLVASAQSAARQADRAMLDEFEAIWRERPERLPAVTLVVLTHIDLLRPHREWSPPYDIVHPQSAKAQAIRAAVDAVTADLRLEPGDVVPVCTHADRLYNIREGLLPGILAQLPEARRAAALRSFRERQQEESWRLWGQQAAAAGQLLARVGTHLGKRAVAEARAAADRFLLGESGK